MEKIDKLLLEKGEVEGARANFLAFYYAATYGVEEKYKHIIIDEAQDLTKIQLDFINILRQDKESGSILYLMDVAQSIYHQSCLVKGCSFKTIGYDMTGKAIAILDSQFNLMSENPKYEPIHIEENDFKVMGKLIGIIMSNSFFERLKKVFE